MPYEGPGKRTSKIATKALVHGAPSVEEGMAGIGAKSQQASPMAVSDANALIARQIAIGEEHVIMLDGEHEVLNSLLPVGAVVGSPLYIDTATNALTLNPDAGQDETQVVTLTAATGGTFTLTLAGQTTAAIAFNASAAAVQTALEALSNVVPGDLSVTGADGGPYTIIFGGNFDSEDVATLVADNANLTGSGHAIAVTTPTAGHAERRIKFGRIDAIDASAGRSLVNLGQRSSF